MNVQSFDWNNTKQLSLTGLILAFALPSAFAYLGFRVVMPRMIDGGMPVLIAWPVVASVMLAILVTIAILLLKKDAQSLNVSLIARMCLKRLSARQWLLYVAIMVLGLVLASGVNQLVPTFMKLTDLTVPDYMPFFLNPGIDPMHASPETLSPGLAIKGQVALLPLFALALLLNILAEEFYFRAWILPKMSGYGSWSWVINAVLFAAYHTFQFWLFPTILAGSLIWAFVIYRSKSIYPALLGHFVGNFLTLVMGLGALILG